MIVFEPRACTILYNLLHARRDPRAVLMPVNVCPAVPLTFRKAGCDFRLVDIVGPDLVMDPQRCLALLRADPTGIGGLLHVRPYGADVVPERLFREVKRIRPDLLVIDDRALCRPEAIGEARGVPGADVTLFSTGRSKYVDLGFGGFAYLRPGVPYRRARGPHSEQALARVTQRCQTAVATRRRFAGGRGDWLDLSRPRVSWADHRRRMLAARQRADEHRRRINAVYARMLPEELHFPPAFQGWRFNLLVPEPDRLVARMSHEGLFAGRHYAALGRAFGQGRFSTAEGLHRWVVNLFNDPRIDEERAQRVARVAAAYLDEAGRPARASAAAARRRYLGAGGA